MTRIFTPPKRNLPVSTLKALNYRQITACLLEIQGPTGNLTLYFLNLITYNETPDKI